MQIASGNLFDKLILIPKIFDDSQDLKIEMEAMRMALYGHAHPQTTRVVMERSIHKMEKMDRAVPCGWYDRRGLADLSYCRPQRTKNRRH